MEERLWDGKKHREKEQGSEGEKRGERERARGGGLLVGGESS